MTIKKTSITLIFAAIIMFNFIIVIEGNAPPEGVEIICDHPQEHEGRCFEQVPGDCDCRWTGYTDDYCTDTCHGDN